MQARTPALPSMLRTRPYGRAPAPSIGRCIYCGRAEGLLTREHVIPKSLGGHFQAPQDPNWFYSFLSQSAAAVIGVLGAVLVSRLLQALLEARASAARVIDSFVATRNALVARTNEIEGYAAFLADKLPPLQALLDRGESTFDTTHWQEFGTSTSGGSFRKELSRELLVQMRADEQACGLILSTLPPITTRINIASVAARIGTNIQAHEVCSVLGPQVPCLD